MCQNIELLDEYPTNDIDNSLPHINTAKGILNIIYNNSNINNKVILLSGVRGSGKTTILKQLSTLDKLDKNNKLFINLDAWNAPEHILKKEFLRNLYRGILYYIDKISNIKNKVKFKKKIKRNMRDIDTIIKEQKSKIRSETIIIYLFIFIIIPIISIDSIYSNIVSFILNFKWLTIYLYIIFSFLLFSILFYSKSKIVKILFPFLYGTSHNYSEYEEGKDFTPYDFKRLLQKFYNLYINYLYKDIVLIIDNLDRLSNNEQENYISCLYTFTESAFNLEKKDKLKINFWFILAVDKTKITNNGNTDISFYEKLSPYEITIPEMNNTILNNYFRSLLETNNKQYLVNYNNIDICSLLDLFNE